MVDLSYRSGFTSKAVVLLSIAVGVGAFLVWIGMADYPKFSARDIMRVPLVFGPMVFGLLIVGAAVLTALGNRNREVVVSRRSLRYLERGDELLRADWSALTFVVRKSGPFRVLVLSDGRSFARVFDLFLPQFNELARELECHARSVRNQSRHKIG